MKKNIPHSDESAIEAFLVGEQIQADDHQSREITKLGILRVGSAGCMVTQDSCIGKCPQTALARFLGYQLPTDASRPYFQGGIANEYTWEEFIKLTGRPYKCEEDIPVVHKLPCGTLITGRPDLVLGQENDEFEPQLMIELKANQATNSAAEKLLCEKPATDHLIQAATYSMFLGIPATLVYTSNVSGGITKFFTRKAAGVNEVSFGKVEFKLGWEDGSLYYMKGSTRVDTVVTQQGILDYYSNIAKMARDKQPGLIYQDMVDIEGNLLPYNPRSYGDIPNLVDDSLVYEDWIEKIANVTSKPYLLKYKTKRGHTPWYEIVKPDYEVEEHKYYRVERFIKRFEDINNAREFIYKEEK